MTTGNIFSSRVRILSLVVFAIMGVFVLRLFYLQVIQHDYYRDLASKEQTRQFTLTAKRGEIYAMDTDNQPVKLVMNQTIYTVFADPKIIDEPERVEEVMRRVAGGNVRDNMSDLVRRKETRYQVIATKISRKQAEMIKKEKLRGIGFNQETERVYPEGQLAAQLLGFVDASGTGRYGVEGYLNKQMTGQDGLLQTVTDIRDIPLTIGKNNIYKPAKDGENIVLTIDRNIQSYTEKALATGLERTGATDASAIVLDPQTGKVMAMANLPTYRPAEYSKVGNIALFNNDVISDPYEPGSVIKTLTVAAGLDKGVITPESKYVNTDYVKVGDRTVTNATKGQTGDITIQHALNWSLNTGMVHVARQLGGGNTINMAARTTMYDYFHNRMRLGESTGIELTGEAPGTLIAPDKPDGNEVRYSNMSFGQGMDPTMLQVASAFASIINGGTYYSPTVVQGTIDTEGNLVAAAQKPARANVISPAASSTVRTMVHDARNAFHGKSDRPGYYIGGKTGTSQTIVGGQYVFSQTIGTYLGFGGDETPRYVIMVRISGKNMELEGAKHAMPIFTDISNWMIDYLKLQPKG